MENEDDESERWEDDDQVVETAETDYYTFLNISKNASQDEIVNAYRRMSKIYHPDKHFDTNRKKDADVLFAKTKEAYEVLNDPHKRAIYDTLGLKGLQTEGWEVVHRTKTPQEIREEYERLASEREYHRLQQRTNPKGTISVGIDATELFETYELDAEESRFFPRIEISSMSIAQSIEAPFSTGNTVSLGGNLTTQSGTGAGSISCLWNHIISDKSRAEFEVSAGSGLMFSLRGHRTISKKSYGNVRTVFRLSPQGLAFGVGFHSLIARQLTKETMSYLTWKTGTSSSVTSTVVRENAKHRYACSLQLGIRNSYLSLSYTRKFENKGKLKGSIKYGTFGIIVEYGCEKKISEQNVLGASIMVGDMTGVSLTIRLSRANQSYIFPIRLSEEILPASIFYGTLAPVIGWYTLKVFVIDPYNKRNKQREAQRARESNATKLAERRREATAAVELMRETYRRISTQEQENGGLVIIEALYGDLSENPEAEETAGNLEVVDVTISLQCLVKDSKLVLTDAAKSSLPGFYDPCFGDEKLLRIKYTFRNLLHLVTIKDNEALRIPKDSHLLRT